MVVAVRHGITEHLRIGINSLKKRAKTGKLISVLQNKKTQAAERVI